MKKLTIIIALTTLSFFGFSQNRTTLGLRVGNFIGVDAKHFFTNARNFGVQLHLNQKTKSADRGALTRITPMLIHQQELRVRLPYDVFWFYGGGHVGYSKYYGDPINAIGDREEISAIESGVDFTIGLEANSRMVPFVFAIDFSPYYNFKDIVDDNAWLNMGFSVRYKLGMKRQ